MVFTHSEHGHTSGFMKQMFISEFDRIFCDNAYSGACADFHPSLYGASHTNQAGNLRRHRCNVCLWGNGVNGIGSHLSHSRLTKDVGYIMPDVASWSQ